MTGPRKPATWAVLATVEVADDEATAIAMPSVDDDDFRFVRAPRAPAGLCWYTASADTARVAVDRASRRAFALLDALRGASERGEISGFRIVDGGHYLTFGDDAPGGGARSA